MRDGKGSAFAFSVASAVPAAVAIAVSSAGAIVDRLKLIRDNPSGLFMMDAELGKRVFTMPQPAAE